MGEVVGMAQAMGKDGKSADHMEVMVSYTDVSIDLETLGTTPGSVITQIGLCAFNQRPRSAAECATSATLIRVDPRSMIEAGFIVDWDTIKWWLLQNDDARNDFVAGDAHSYVVAMNHVTTWMRAHALDRDPTYLRVWGHGCGFDVTQLEIAFHRAKRQVPWDFRMVRDLRTLADMAPALGVPRPRPLLEHNAMQDATAQAEWIQLLTEAIEK